MFAVTCERRLSCLLRHAPSDTDVGGGGGGGSGGGGGGGALKHLHIQPYKIWAPPPPIHTHMIWYMVPLHCGPLVWGMCWSD